MLMKKLSTGFIPFQQRYPHKKMAYPRISVDNSEIIVYNFFHLFSALSTGIPHFLPSGEKKGLFPV